MREWICVELGNPRRAGLPGFDRAPGPSEHTCGLTAVGEDIKPLLTVNVMQGEPNIVLDVPHLLCPFLVM